MRRRQEGRDARVQGTVRLPDHLRRFPQRVRREKDQGVAASAGSPHLAPVHHRQAGARAQGAGQVRVWAAAQQLARAGTTAAVGGGHARREGRPDPRPWSRRPARSPPQGEHRAPANHQQRSARRQGQVQAQEAGGRRWKRTRGTRRPAHTRRRRLQVRARGDDAVRGGNPRAHRHRLPQGGTRVAAGAGAGAGG